MSNLAAWIVLLSVLSASATYGESNPYLRALQSKPWQSVQDYVEVRPGAHLFYWLYFADGTPVQAEQRPLLIWIQGGPGLAASGVANFAEIGPLDMNMEPRNHTWVNGRNVLLIDHPVGAGFSYADDPSVYATTDKQAVEDLARVIKRFFKKHKRFQSTPTYLLGQSYGGKLLPRLAYLLHRKRLKINFKGIGIGSGWVDPKESTLIQPEYLYNMGVIDRNMYDKSLILANRMAHYIDTKNYVAARSTDNQMFEMLTTEWGPEHNFNNINQHSPYRDLEKLSSDINAYVKPTLSIVNQNLTWNYISDRAFDSLKDNFLVPTTKFLELILNQTKLKVAVYNGNLDVVTPLAGASNWAHKLRWPGAKTFRGASRWPIQGERNGFYKTSRQFSFWWVFGSGHWVPEDNPVAMEQILEYLTQDEDANNVHMKTELLKPVT